MIKKTEQSLQEQKYKRRYIIYDALRITQNLQKDIIVLNRFLEQISELKKYSIFNIQLSEIKAGIDFYFDGCLQDQPCFKCLDDRFNTL